MVNIIFNFKNTIILFISFIFAAEDLVYDVSISGTIDMGLPHYIERVVNQAETNGASIIIFEIDTFGGRVDAATQIKDIILDSKIPTVAFINKRAISAGALISLSCDSIYMTSGASIGAATAVSLDGKKASEKVISYMREEMATTAEANNKSREIASAMVDEELYIEYFLSASGDTITASDVEGFKEGKLITLSTNLALKLGIADGKFNTKEDLLSGLGIVSFKKVEFKESWSERLVRFLTNPVVSPLFMSLGMLGLFIEIRTPGLGLPGLTGLICLSLFFGSHFLVGLADITELIFLILGLLLIILEIAVIPGFGILGIPGLVLVFYSIFKMLMGDNPSSTDFHNAYLGLSIGIILSTIFSIIIYTKLPKTQFYKKNIPFSSQRSKEGYSIANNYDNLIGEVGLAATDLRPSGKIEIKGKIYQAISTDDFINYKQDIVILGVSGNQLVVKKA